MEDPTASSLGLTQRRTALTQPPQQQVQQLPGSRGGGAAAGRSGPKTWVLWMLFGLGWPSLLFFGLSLLPRISSMTEWWLLLSGWLCLACWWGGTAAGSFAEGGSSSLSFRQRQAWQACSSMSLFGTALGVLLMTGYAYRNWHLLQMAPLAIAVGVIVYSILNPAPPSEPKPDDEADSRQRLAAAQEAAAQEAAAAAADADEQR